MDWAVGVVNGLVETTMLKGCEVGHEGRHRIVANCFQKRSSIYHDRKAPSYLDELCRSFSAGVKVKRNKHAIRVLLKGAIFSSAYSQQIRTRRAVCSEYSIDGHKRSAVLFVGKPFIAFGIVLGVLGPIRQPPFDNRFRRARSYPIACNFLLAGDSRSKSVPRDTKCRDVTNAFGNRNGSSLQSIWIEVGFFKRPSAFIVEVRFSIYVIT
jgi:hypothetical protein